MMTISIRDAVFNLDQMEKFNENTNLKEGRLGVWRFSPKFYRVSTDNKISQLWFDFLKFIGLVVDSNHERFKMVLKTSEAVFEKFDVKINKMKYLSTDTEITNLKLTIQKMTNDKELTEAQIEIIQNQLEDKNRSIRDLLNDNNKKTEEIASIKREKELLDKKFLEVNELQIGHHNKTLAEKDATIKQYEVEIANLKLQTIQLSRKLENFQKEHDDKFIKHEKQFLEKIVNKDNEILKLKNEKNEFSSLIHSYKEEIKDLQSQLKTSNDIKHDIIDENEKESNNLKAQIQRLKNHVSELVNASPRPIERAFDENNSFDNDLSRSQILYKPNVNIAAENQ